jgi:YhcH/YjgK/YiaL family protein
MISDRLDNSDRYLPLHPEFARVFNFIKDLTVFPSERMYLNGEKSYVMFSSGQAKPESDAVLEAHRKYIDIHFCVEGIEDIGWRPIQSCRIVRADYAEAKDAITFNDSPELWVRLVPGSFAVFFPEDAHATMVGDGMIRKAIAKVAV